MDERQGGATNAALLIGVAVPVFYFGVQLVAAPFYQGYDFLRDAASALGSPVSTQPWIFNTGAMLTGVAALAAAFGHGRHAVCGARPRWSLILAALALLGLAISCFWAGWYPAPDPRHGTAGAFGMGAIVYPPLFLAAIRKTPDARGARIFFAATIVMLAALFPVMSRLLPLDLSSFGGLVQRVAAFFMFVPAAAGCLVLLRERRAG